jgi:hypothetical protein
MNVQEQAARLTRTPDGVCFTYLDGYRGPPSRSVPTPSTLGGAEVSRTVPR